MKTAIVYAREMRGENLQAQIDACRQYALGLGFTVVAAVVDLQTHGPAYRLGLRGAMDMVVAGDVEGLVALNPERVSKDPARLQPIQEMLQEKHCTLYYVQE
jgi:DNA invertase Pin-like site-specific DNA recombinase